MKIPILHLVLLLGEVFADNNLEFGVRPVSIVASMLASLSVSMRPHFVGVVLELFFDGIDELGRINSLEHDIYRLGDRCLLFQGIGVLRHSSCDGS